MCLLMSSKICGCALDKKTKTSLPISCISLKSYKHEPYRSLQICHLSISFHRQMPSLLPSFPVFSGQNAIKL